MTPNDKDETSNELTGYETFGADNCQEVDCVSDDTDESEEVCFDGCDEIEIYVKISDPVSAVSDFLQTLKKMREKHPELYLYTELSPEELLADYHKLSANEKKSEYGRKLRNEVFYKTYFLIPHVMKKNYWIRMAIMHDAVQNMSIAVIKAIENYNPEYNIPLKGYITKYMKAAASQTFRESGVITLPPGRKKKDQKKSDEPIPNELQYTHGLEYTPNIRTEMDSPDFCEEIHVKELVEILIDAISPEAGILTPDEREIVILRHGLMGMDHLPYQEISKIRKAQSKGETCSRISQIYTSAVKKLRAYFRECGLLPDQF